MSCGRIHSEADVWSAGTPHASVDGRAPMVNWDVVSHDWDGMKQQIREVAIDIEKGWKRITS
jgi:hypothetical protein